MKVTASDSGVVTVTMTHDQLIAIRYSLAHAAQKFEETARFFRRMSDPEARSAEITARASRAAGTALEKAALAWTRRPRRTSTKRPRPKKAAT